MPIQPEQKIFPQQPVPPPSVEEELFQWALNLSRAFQDLSKEISDKYNAHVDQTHAHPKSWMTLRVNRPAYVYSAADKVKVVASSAKPVYLKVGPTLLEATSDLVLDIDLSGPGGLRSGLTKATNTLYYLYGVNNSGVAALLADTVAPSTGPTGYDDWTYLGAFVTDGSSNIIPFSSSGGKLRFGATNAAEQVTSSDTSPTAKTLRIPANAKFVFFRLRWTAVNAIGDSCSVGPLSTSVFTASAATSATVGNNSRTFSESPVLEPQTIYMSVTSASDTVENTIMGWNENPAEYS